MYKIQYINLCKITNIFALNDKNILPNPKVFAPIGVKKSQTLGVLFVPPKVIKPQEAERELPKLWGFLRYHRSEKKTGQILPSCLAIFNCGESNEAISHG